MALQHTYLQVHETRFWELLTESEIAPTLVKHLCELLDSKSLRALSACARNKRALDERMIVGSGVEGEDKPSLPVLVEVKLLLILKPLKGWSVVAAERLAADFPILIYSGAYIRKREAEKRRAEKRRASRSCTMTYVLECREHFPGGFCMTTTIDAERVGGGLARFVNHGCAPNIRVTMFRQSREFLLPVVLFMTDRVIEPGEELSYSYDGTRDDDADDDSRVCSTTPCACRADRCLGFLPKPS